MPYTRNAVALVVLALHTLVVEAGRKKAPPPPPPPPIVSPVLIGWIVWIAVVVGGFFAVKMAPWNKAPSASPTTDPALAASTKGVADLSKSGRNAWGISMAKM